MIGTGGRKRMARTIDYVNETRELFQVGGRVAGFVAGCGGVWQKAGNHIGRRIGQGAGGLYRTHVRGTDIYRV